MSLNVRVTQHSDRSVITLDGELDISSAARLLATVGEALAGGGRNLLIDAAGLTFCDSHGLEALLKVQGEVTAAGGTMELVHVHGRVRRVMELTGLERAFTLTETR